MEEDIRWEQRFKNYCNALQQLQKALEEIPNPTDIEKEGTIQRFEFTHELSWKVLKDFLEHHGVATLIGSRDAVRYAFQNGIISNGQVWMNMIESRNRTLHTYQVDILNKEYLKIKEQYYPLFQELKNTLQVKLSKN